MDRPFIVYLKTRGLWSLSTKKMSDPLLVREMDIESLLIMEENIFMDPIMYVTIYWYRDGKMYGYTIKVTGLSNTIRLKTTANIGFFGMKKIVLSHLKTMPTLRSVTKKEC